MLTFRACTWNMARSRLVPDRYYNEEKQRACASRTTGLTYLAKHNDVIFLNEVGIDVRNLGGGILPPTHNWYTDPRETGQKKSAETRNFLGVKGGTVNIIMLKSKSGKKGKERHPSAVIWERHGHRVLLISWHGTSGGGGENAEVLLQELDDYLVNQHERVSTALAGGDFNARRGKFGTRIDTVKGPTQSKGYTLDGFYAVSIEGAGQDNIELGTVQIENGFGLWAPVPPDREHDEDRAAYKRRRDSALAPWKSWGYKPGAYFLEPSWGNLWGWRPFGATYAGTKVSDHLPLAVNCTVEKEPGQSEEQDVGY